jgi:hypothetical protein
LTPDSDGAFSNTVAKGLVINQSPAAGTVAYAGDIVTITVSFGVERNTVPVTAGLSAAAAEAALIAAGLVLGTSTSSMTDDTEAGLVASSSPAAGTGVAAGSAVDLVVSLGDRHTRLRLIQGGGQALNVRVNGSANFQWYFPDGTTQRTDDPAWAAPEGEDAVIYIVMDAGHTVAEITQFRNGVASSYLPSHVWQAEDLQYCRPNGLFSFQNASIAGDIASLADAVTIASQIIITGVFNYFSLYGSVSSWGLVNAILVTITDTRRVSGYLTFKANAPTNAVTFYNSTGFSYADIAQTIINWDAANAGVFARTGSFNRYKRSLIGAANPAAEAAIVSLTAKGASWTFLAE